MCGQEVANCRIGYGQFGGASMPPLPTGETHALTTFLFFPQHSCV